MGCYPAPPRSQNSQQRLDVEVSDKISERCGVVRSVSFLHLRMKIHSTRGEDPIYPGQVSLGMMTSDPNRKGRARVCFGEGVSGEEREERGESRRPCGMESLNRNRFSRHSEIVVGRTYHSYNHYVRPPYGS